MGRAVQLAANEDFDRMKSEVLDIMKKISELEINQIAERVKLISEEKKKEKLDIDDYLDLCFTWYRDVLLYKACRDTGHIIFKEELREIGRAAARYSYEGIERIIRSIDKARSRIAANVNFDLTMELMFMEMKAG